MELKSTYQKGKEFEINLSKKVPDTPVLISSKLLRSYGCGQVDLAFMRNKILFLCELKTTAQSLSILQRRRLLNSGFLLSKLLEVNYNVVFYSGKKILPK